MSRKTILYLITQSEFGGAQRYCFDLAINLKADYEVVMAFGEQGEKGALARKLSENQIKYYPINFLKRSISPFSDIIALIQIISLIKKTKPDIIHLNSSKISILGSLAIWVARLGLKKTFRTVYTAHGWVFNEPLPAWQKNFYILAEKITARFKDVIICVSHFDYETAIKNKIALEEKLVVVHNGIEPINFLAKNVTRKKLNLAPNQFVVGSIGNLYKTKGYKYLVETVKILKDGGINITAVIIGEGDERRKLTALIKKYNLEDRVILIGRIDEAAEFLSAFDIYVCSSVKEGLSYTIIEAMWAGLPIVATKVGGNEELISSGETGLLAEAKDPEAMAEKIKGLINDLETKENLGVRARMKAEQEFTISKMVTETKKIYSIF